jgi:hypothetical protein
MSDIGKKDDEIKVEQQKFFFKRFLAEFKEVRDDLAE